MSKPNIELKSLVRATMRNVLTAAPGAPVRVVGNALDGLTPREVEMVLGLATLESPHAPVVTPSLASWVHGVCGPNGELMDMYMKALPADQKEKAEQALAELLAATAEETAHLMQRGRLHPNRIGRP